MAARTPLAWSHTAISWTFRGTATAATPARVNFGNACDPTSVPLPGAERGPCPWGILGEPGTYACREGNTHKRGLFPQSLYRRQTEQTNERVLVGYPNWSWTVVNSLRAEFQTVRRPSFMAHPYCIGFEVLSVCNNRGRANLAAHWGVGAKEKPHPPSPWSPFPRVRRQSTLQRDDGWGEVRRKGVGGCEARQDPLATSGRSLGLRRLAAVPPTQPFTPHKGQQPSFSFMVLRGLSVAKACFCGDLRSGGGLAVQDADPLPPIRLMPG